MEHQTESYLSAKFMTQLSSLLTKELLEEVQQVLTLTLSTEILKNGLKLESQKETLIDSRLIYINAQLLAISLCENLSKEMSRLEIDGVNFLESEKQLESRTFCLRETLIKTIHKLTKQTD